jgi:uncharacterized membrane protein YkvA (DUF1232 family)
VSPETLSSRVFGTAARGAHRFREAARPRTGAKRTILHTIQQLPSYLRLLGGLFTDRRVSAVDKLLVGAAIAYILAPVDFIPDLVPFMGQVDDVFLLMTSMQRLIANAGRRVVAEHWHGDAEELRDLNVRRVISAAAFFLPLGLRRKLGKVGRR